MFAAIYDENLNHITNIQHLVYDLTRRVYDFDTFNVEGVSPEDINNAKIAVINDDYGNYKYACFVDYITPENDKRKIKAKDLRDLWDNEILIDYTAEDSFDPQLDAIFSKIAELLFATTDAVITKIPVEVNIPEDTTDTSIMFGSLQGTYQIANAYAFLKIYLKYYEYNINSYFDVNNGKIIFDFVKNTEIKSINLKDFIYELTTTSSATNKTVATIEFKPTEEIAERPSDIATKYYYRLATNEIAESTASGDILDRIYPVKCKVFEAEYLAEAQLNAVYELADARYVDNIIISANQLLDPINLTNLPLYTKIQIHYDGQLYKTLPVGEIITQVNRRGENTQIRLGFKKILFTEIVKKGV